MSEIQPFSVSDLEKMAIAIAKSNLFGMKTPEQALALMLLSQAEGLHPATAARDYHIIQGRPALKADAILARFQAAGGRVEWLEYSDARVAARFSHPAGGSVEIDWTLERAKTAGLAGRDSWRQYPRQMLRARVISEGVRTVYPAVLVGMYTPEEVADMDAPVSPANAPQMAAPVSQPLPPPPSDSVGVTEAQVRKIGAILSNIGATDRTLSRQFCEMLLGRELSSVKDLSKAEASELIELLSAPSAGETWADFLASQEFPS